MTRLAALTLLLALAACGDIRPGPTPAAARPLWQNTPGNATYEPPGSRPPGS